MNKQTISTIAAITILTLSLVLAAIPIASASPITIHIAPTLVATDPNTAVWSIEQAKYGSSSAKLTVEPAGHAAVEIIPLSGTTIADLAEITSGWSFWYYSDSGDRGPLLELRFVGPENIDPGGAHHVDITVNTAELAPVTDEWHEEKVTSASTVIYFGNNPDGSGFSDNTGSVTLAGVEASIEAASAYTDVGDWELVRVRAEIGYSNTEACISYIDDVKIDGVTYAVEPAKGNVGDEVTVYGEAAPFSTVTVYWENLAGPVLATTAADSTGAWSTSVTIPSAVNGEHYIVATDGTGTAGVPFIVEASLSAGVPPVRALPGDEVTLTGHGFSKTEEVTVKFGTITLEAPTITTNATGSFSAVIIVPDIDEEDYDTYTVTATDASGVSATTDVEVDYYVTVTPPTGPTGITVTIAGRIPANTAYELRFGAASIATGTSAADGAFSDVYTTDSRTATFTVSTAPTIETVPDSGAPGKVIAITGQDFCAGANITLYFGDTIVNSTALDSRFGPTDENGDFDAEFTVPDLAPGIYAIKVVDEFGASSQVGKYFTVLPAPATTVALRGTSYYPGDTLSFIIETTESSITELTVTIYDPSGKAQWTITGWELTDTDTAIKIVPIMSQVDDLNKNPITLPADAPLGTWNWTITYKPASTGKITKATGLFSVVPMPTMQTVLDALDAAEASIIDVVTDSEGDLTAVINTKAGTITTKLDAINPKLQGLEDLGVVIATDVDDVQLTLEDLDIDALGLKIDSIQGDVATIKSNIGTITTSVDSLGAKVTSLSGDVATVSTKLGTLEGTVASIDGKTATVKTDVGLIKADVSDILAKPDVDITPVWIAVVLSLIAAIAAIFAVVTIRQKIAG